MPSRPSKVLGRAVCRRRRQLGRSGNSIEIPPASLPMHSVRFRLAGFVAVYVVRAESIFVDYILETLSIMCFVSGQAGNSHVSSQPAGSQLPASNTTLPSNVVSHCHEPRASFKVAPRLLYRGRLHIRGRTSPQLRALRSAASLPAVVANQCRCWGKGRGQLSRSPN